MNQLPRFDPHLRETSVRDHYDGVAQSAIKMILRRRRLIGVALVVGFVMGIAGLILIKKTYTADALIQLTFSRDEQTRTGSSAQSTGTAVEASALVESEARLLRSRAVARRVVARLNLAADPEFAPATPFILRFESWLPDNLRTIRPWQTPSSDQTFREDLIAHALLQGLSVTNDIRSYIIGVSYASADPERSAKIVNAFLDEYISNNMETGVRAAQRTSDWVASQIRQTRASLDIAESAVNAYRRQSGFLELSTDGGMPQQQLQNLSARLDAATALRLAEEARVAHAKEVFVAGGVPSAEDLAGAPVIRELLENREKQRRELVELALNGPKHPGLSRARSALDDTETRLHAEIEGAIKELDGRLRSAADAEAALAAHIRQTKDTAIDFKKRETQLKSLQLDATSLRDRLKVLTESYAQAIAAAGLASTSAQVVMRAEAIPLPSGPNPVVIFAVAMLGATAIGIGGAYLLENRHDGLRSEAELSAETQTPCLGMIPDQPKRPKPSDKRLFEEAIRFLAASIDVQTAAAFGRVLLITSSVAKEGKSDVGRALATEAARNGGRALIVDVASRSTEETGTLSLPLDAAVSDPDAFLRDFADDPVVRLAAPRWIASDDLTCMRLAAFIERVRSSFEIIILEAPPVLQSLDFLPLARLADLVVHLARWGTTPRETIAAAFKRFDSLSVRVCGTLMTHVDPATNQGAGRRGRGASSWDRRDSAAKGPFLGSIRSAMKRTRASQLLKH
ncbi:exopolysaccharide transport family protein [Methylobacterium sp. J-059]|uniref:GumC family protein n=1 Tax=Methylobacterium sp. J-059 TaxID=2836643 RepID=UPI001FBA8562|nr:exopolysaccharide transport family protein [Methylobacterium sp. J-059]MCJ2041930.1 exopolysaccharide transport family protein [Methylobacterium sp. J-059]